ncbi:30S ribosomal protein S16 [Coxiella endosymbiont of Amblyomma nuttalli]|uniref:30S ribosomal protein S16 n=1 Tax=Coxiella endosymbiont of Amblyomma nuttalli TaxID=2749996 RepID=UPI001BA5F0FF|nr:30S ribosomal protein S16 [Coxiella endosymbiont of Amblyomma nuttalli]QTS83991.1 30S ribosomal protein S16 [Coxiella endosymbiont of Amblyomma nuttalli]
MVVVRLTRSGGKKNPFYHIVIADCRYSRDGRFIERVGYYNPLARGKNIPLYMEKKRIVYWLNQGAQATLRVQHLIKKFEKLPEAAKEGSLRKAELKRLQSEQSSIKAHQAQDTVAEKLLPDK